MELSMYLYEAKLIGLSPSIEEEVAVEVNGVQIVGFAHVCPYKIELNKIYPIELTLEFFDGEDFKELKEEKYNLQHIGDAYSYILSGKVIEDSLDIGDGIRIYDELFEEYTYLNGSFIEMKVDRLCVAFV
jgi:hypothetical protein